MSTTDKRYRLLIGGEWVDGAEGTSPVINPATEEIVGHAPEASVAQAEAAARAAQEAFPKWWRASRHTTFPSSTWPARSRR
ncbi:MAG: aldehyde dehydrogenase family protein, partial [Actinobacteria bacterium]|nr:aldehyde dehydrogenase family protein [Actinomycetota bacterium]